MGDRINLLKILSYDKTWRLDEKILVKMFKSLILSVLDYASIIASACNNEIKKSLETIQNNSLRIIFKKGLLDKIPTAELRNKAGITTIEERHRKLMLDYYERALTSGNPLILDVFESFKKFKKRNFISEELAINEHEIVNLETLSLIRTHNLMSLKEVEIYPTTLCQASKIFEAIGCSYEVGHVRGVS